MTNIDIILKAIDFTEKNLKDDIAVLDIARAAGYSLFHFSRLFGSITGHSPGDYLLRRRLSEAGREIQSSSRKIIDIAFDYQFNSPEVFTRAFRRMFGFSPSHLRKNKNNPHIPYLKPLTKQNLSQVAKIKNNEPEIIELGAICLIGMQTLVREDFSIITRLWYRFHEIYHQIDNRILPEKFIQLSYIDETSDLKQFYCMVAVESENLERVEGMFIAKTLPSAQYLRFIHKGRSDKVELTYKYIYQTYLPKSEYKLTLPYEFEYYGDNFCGPENEDSESEIYIPLKVTQ